MTVLELYSLDAGAGVALIAAQALHASPLVRVAHAAAAPVQVAREIVCALDVHVDLFCGDETDRGEGLLWERRARQWALTAEEPGGGLLQVTPLDFSKSGGSLVPPLPGWKGAGAGEAVRGQVLSLLQNIGGFHEMMLMKILRAVWCTVQGLIAYPYY